MLFAYIYAINSNVTILIDSIFHPKKLLWLKTDKQDGYIWSLINSSAFINVPFLFIKLVHVLINAVIAHEYVPKNWLSPLPKSIN